MILNQEFSGKGRYGFTEKASALVTGQAARTPKPGKIFSKINHVAIVVEQSQTASTSAQRVR